MKVAGKHMKPRHVSSNKTVNFIHAYDACTVYVCVCVCVCACVRACVCACVCVCVRVLCLRFENVLNIFD